MAVLSKIRERSLFLILVIGLALFAFVLDPSKISDFFNANKVNQVGEVNGEVISRQDFAQALEAYKTQTGNRVSEMQASKTVWNNLVRKKIYETQLAAAGITIGEADIMNSLYESPTIQNDPRFQSSELFDKAKLKEHLATIKADNGQEWKAWQNYMASVKDNLQKTTYDNLVSAGLGASLTEGKFQYLTENTKINADYVYVPYASVSDSLISIKKSEVKSYIENHKEAFQVEASRDIKFVKFEIKPTSEDEEVAKNEVAKLLEDSKDYGTKGLKNTTEYRVFMDENKSDLPLNEKVQFKANVSKKIAENIFNGNKGDVFGPYKEDGYFKISKVTEVLELPDSVKASHILIPFVGSRAATKETKKTKEEVKKQADSLLTIVKDNPAKFSDLAKELSQDKSNAEKGGDLGWFTYDRMVTEFRDFSFENKKGDIGIVETIFGYHIIKIEDQKNIQKAVKLATFARKIEASETTENTVFQNAETFALEVSKSKKFEDVVKEKNLTSLSAQGLKALDENVPSLGKERSIVSWAFEKDVEVGAYKRFDIKGGYVVAVVTSKINKGLMPVDKAAEKVRPILLKEKKVKIINEKLSGSTLSDIAKSADKQVKKLNNVNLKSPIIPAVGFEPKVVGGMLNAKENKVYNNVTGDKGVYAFKVTSKELPTALPNYNTLRTRIAKERKNKTYQMFEAVKKASNVKDELSSFYGITQ